MKNPIKVKFARRTIAVAFMVLAVSTVFFAGKVTSAAMQTVFINSDGSVDPASVPIQRSGNTYFFTGNIYACLIVNKSDVVIDGAGYTLRGALNETPTDVWIGQGPNSDTSNETTGLYTIGIDAASRNITGLTIKNLNIKEFSIGMYIWTTNNTITGNAVMDNIVGVLLSGSNNDIVGNYIAGNERGIFFGTNQPGNIPLNLTISRNSFINNTNHFSGCVCKEYNMSETMHTWDNGKEGNYWDNYNGTDVNSDGIGDTPYVIDVLNQDRYPLMQSHAAPPTVAAKEPVEIVIPVAAIMTITIVAVVAVRRRQQKA